jgi:hypothetical protein
VENAPGQQQPRRDPRLDLRVSHADRERVAERLRQAAGEGRLDIEELEERLERALTAKTYADFEGLLADLPGHGVPAVQQPRTPPPAVPPHRGDAFPVPYTTAVGGTPTVYRSQAILGDQRREGAWVVPRAYTATSVMGSVMLDLREASFAEREAVVSCTVFMGDVKIRVAPDVTVVEEVTTVMADARVRSSAELPPPPGGGPVLYVRGTAVMGDVTVERLAPGEKKLRRRRKGS